MERPPEFSVEVVARAGGIVVAPRGEVDIATVEEVRSACAVGDGTVVLDLRAVEFLDTSGLNLVIECQRRADRDGPAFAVVRGTPRVQRLFDILALNHRLRLVDHPAEALGDGPTAG